MQSAKRQFRQIFKQLGDSLCLFFFGLFGKKNSHKFTLLADQLYTREPIKVKNSRIKISRRDLHLSAPTQTIEEDVYLFLLYEDNLAHLFHDIFFPLYAIWRQDKKKIFVSINENQFIKDFLVAAFGGQYLIFSNKNTIYNFNRLTITPEGRDLKIHANYIQICDEIKNNCFNSLGIKENRSKNLVYGRNELKRKNLLAIDPNFLEAYNLEKVILSTLTFKDLISLLAQAKSFTYMVGAGVFYLLFLARTVPVLEINPAKNNSWAQMFGMDQLCNLNVFVSQNIEISNEPAQGEPILDSHVYFDEGLKKVLISILPKN
jgi:hypothetical protein